MKPSKDQVGGDHYKTFAIQPAEFIHKNGIGFLEGNVIKYVCRHATKHGRADLLKAKHYIELLLEWQYGDDGQTAPPGELVIASATLEEVRRMASAGAPLITEPAMTYPPRRMDPEGAINADAYAPSFQQTAEFKTWPYAEPEHPSCERHGLTICKACKFPSGTNR